MAVSGDAVAVLAAKFAVMRKVADERAWRVYLGSEAVALGMGGSGRWRWRRGYRRPRSRRVCGRSSPARSMTCRRRAGPRRRGGRGRRRPGTPSRVKGRAEGAGRGGHARGPDGGDHVVLAVAAGDRAADGRAGVRCGKDAIARMMREDGYSLQGMAKVLEGRQHPGRDAQFRHLNARIAEFGEAGEPVISVDTKKKEQLGGYYRDGRSWRPKGNPVKVRDHDFPDDELGKITPYGVYDIAANRGFVSVGTSCDTGAFAVNALRLWWQEEGAARYPHATRLLVTCRFRRLQRRPLPAVERPAASPRGADRAADRGVPLPARHVQVEQVCMAWWPPRSDEMLRMTHRARSPSQSWSAESP